MKRLGVIFLLPAAAVAAPDEDLLGRAHGYPLCDKRLAVMETRCFVATSSRMDEVFPARRVPRAQVPRPLKRAAAEPKIGYVQGFRSRTLDDYLARNRTTGLLILKDDTILVERYQYERNAEHRLNSYSMAKTVVAMLIGIALHEGRIASLDDRAEKYVAELQGTAYGETPIRHLLTMSSGIRFVERYDGTGDMPALGRATLGWQSAGGAATVATFGTRERAPGEVFNYASADTQVLGLVVRGATGRNLSDYLAEKIWQPMGAEADATWLIDRGDHEIAYAWLNATLRDWARLGMLLAKGGALDGRQIIPTEWIKEATSVRGPHLAYGTIDGYFGYGYQTRVLPDGRTFALMGLRGQAVYVDPQTKLVMVHTGVREAREPGYAEQTDLWNSILRQLHAAAIEATP